MSEEKPKRSVRECLEALEKLTAETGAGEYAYRGQENAEWKLESAAARRLRQGSMEHISFEKYHKEVILEPARMDGYGVKDGRELSDLELLADLQHHGTATYLIDFTRNFLVALWFATFKDKENDGKVFVVNTNQAGVFRPLKRQHLGGGIKKNLGFHEMEIQTSELVPGRMETFFGNPRYWYWSPHDLNQRIMKQDSLFIFGQKGVDEDGLAGSISISKDCKEKIQKELRVLGITRGSLFKDLPGFAALHAHDEPLPMDFMTVDAYYLQGMAKLNSGDYEGAVSDFTRALDLNGQFGLARYHRGYAKLALEQYEDALEDFDYVIERDENYALAYAQRAYAKAALGKYEEALENYDQMIELDPIFLLAYYRRGKLRLHLGDKKGAREDFIHEKELAEGREDSDMVETINQELAQLDKEKDST